MTIKIRRFKKRDSKEVSKFLIKIFNEDNSKEVSPEGLNFFLATHSPENIGKNWPKTYVLVVEDKGKIIAIARAKKNGWNTHLFVHKKYRGKGLARELEKRRDKWHKSIGNRSIQINSSPYSLEHHKKLGYKQTGKKKFYHEIPIIPMKKFLENRY